MATPTPTTPKSKTGVFLGNIHAIEALLRDARGSNKSQISTTTHPTTTTHSTTEPAQADIRKLKDELQFKYQELLLYDYYSAQQADTESRLWKTCLYPQITEYRKIIPSALPSEKSVLVKVFNEVLLGACGFYNSLLTRLALDNRLEAVLVSQHKLGLKGLTVRSYPPSENGADSSVLNASPLMGCHRCLIVIGDLYRYLHQLHDSSKNQYIGLARASYNHALRLVPENGAPHNLLAVIAAQEHDTLSAAYHYARSLLILHPSLQGMENFVSLLRRLPAAISNASSEPKRNLLLLVNVLCSQFVADKSTPPPPPPPPPPSSSTTAVTVAPQLSQAKTNEILNSLIFSSNRRESPLLMDQNGPIKLAVLAMYAVHESYRKVGAFEKEFELALTTLFDIFDSLVLACVELVGQYSYSAVVSAVKILCDWCRASISIWQGVSVAMSHRVWRSLSALLNGHVTNLLVSDSHSSSGPLVDWQQSTPLPEDYETRGFLPLWSASHLSLVRDAMRLSACPRPVEPALQLRARCVLAFGCWLVSMPDLEGLLDVPLHYRVGIVSPPQQQQQQQQQSIEQEPIPHHHQQQQHSIPQQPIPQQQQQYQEMVTDVDQPHNIEVAESSTFQPMEVVAPPQVNNNNNDSQSSTAKKEKEAVILSTSNNNYNNSRKNSIALSNNDDEFGDEVMADAYLFDASLAPHVQPTQQPTTQQQQQQQQHNKNTRPDTLLQSGDVSSVGILIAPTPLGSWPSPDTHSAWLNWGAPSTSAPSTSAPSTSSHWVPQGQSVQQQPIQHQSIQQQNNLERKNNNANVKPVYSNPFLPP